MKRAKITRSASTRGKMRSTGDARKIVGQKSKKRRTTSMRSLGDAGPLGRNGH